MNIGEFDLFVVLILFVKVVGVWVYVDGVFGLWVCVLLKCVLMDGIDGVDSWMIDGYKWFNMLYDGVMVICCDVVVFVIVMNSDVVYLSGVYDV